MTQATKVDIQENSNIARFWRDLNILETIPSLADYAPLGQWQDYAMEMRRARARDGEPGGQRLKAVLTSRNNLRQKTSQDKLLIRILSGGVDEQETVTQVGILLSDVKPEQVKWSWHKRIALGKLSCFDGDPGLGKSIATLDIIARITTNRPMPDGSACLTPGGAVIITPEDGLADTIQPRLARAGARLDKVVSISTLPAIDPSNPERTYQRPFTLPDDLPILAQAIDRVEAKIVVIDPIMAVMGGEKDTYKDNEVRSILGPLIALAEEKQVAVLMVRHWTKGGGNNAKYRGGGSMAFIGASRTGFMFTEDPDDNTRVIFANIKNNIAPMHEVDSLIYQIVNDKEASGDERPYINWQGASAHTVQELMSPAPAQPGANRQEIINLLKEHGGFMSPHEIWQTLSEENPELEENNVRTTLNRMRKANQVVSPAYGQYGLPYKE